MESLDFLTEENISNKRTTNSRNYKIDVVATFFGISAWIGTNSIFLQLPLLVQSAPEGWNLPSYIVISSQFANIGPLIYTLYRKFSQKLFGDSYIIYALLFTGTASALLVSLYCQETVWLGNQKYSVPLYFFTFLFALVGCTSSVLFIPFMGKFPEKYLVTYLLGEGLSGLVTSILTMIQGAGGNVQCILVNGTNGKQYYEKYHSPPLFSSKDFFLVIFFIMCCSGSAFIILNGMKKSQKKTSQLNEQNLESKTILTAANRAFLMFLMTITCMFGNTILPSIESYSCLPYSNQIYHLNIIFRLLANPAACFLAIFWKHKTIKVVLTFFVVATITGTYVITTAVLSPNPPFSNTDYGGPLLVITWTILIGSITYIKVSINCLMRSIGEQYLVWVGAFAQVGSLLGSILIFFLINYTKIFKSYELCK